MAEVSFKLELDKRSKRFLRKFPNAFKQGFHKGLILAMKEAEGKAKISFGKTGKPKVVTGHLRRSIQSRVLKRGGNDLIGQLWSDVIYASTHEFGDPVRNIIARPYLKPAIEDNIDSIEEIVQREIFREFERI